MAKQFLNDPNTCVDDCLSGLTAVHSGLIMLPGHRAILRRDLQNIKGKVALLSGGGSGHEPAHAGYVGRGMLTGAICGHIFTSPTPNSIFAAIKAVNNYKPTGIILILKNYTGDRINFGLAKELAANDNIKVEMVILCEDCALTSADRTAGRRGLAGVIFLHKIGGALAENGEPLEYIVEVLNEIARNMGTIGVCLQPCVLPGSESASFHLEDTQIELGVGIHGEAGVKRVSIRNSRDIVQMMINHMTDETSSTHLQLRENDKVALLVNNLGSTSYLEMGIVTKDILQELQRRKLDVQRVYSGPFVTSLQMSGISLTVLRLSKLETLKCNVLTLLDMPTNVSNPLINVSCPNGSCTELDLIEFCEISERPQFTGGPTINENQSCVLMQCVKSSSEALIEIEDILNDYDSGVGDGDCGSTHSRGARAILNMSQEVEANKPAALFQRIGQLCSNDMSGSSGAMYSILFTSMAVSLRKAEIFNLETMALSFQSAVNAVKQYGGAQMGDRTMIDVLEPISQLLLTSKKTKIVDLLHQVDESAKLCAKKTQTMKARAGRASYVDQSLIKHADPGAFAVASVLSTCAKILIEAYTKEHIDTKQ